jgi:hypothetical protein
MIAQTFEVSYLVLTLAVKAWMIVTVVNYTVAKRPSPAPVAETDKAVHLINAAAVLARI